MAGHMGILFCLVVISMGLTTHAIAVKAPEENESNEMESSIKSRSDYPDYDDLSSFFDFEIGPPSITYKDAAENKEKTSLQARLNGNKKYYYYHSDGYPKEKDPHLSSATKKKVVTPGTHYKSSTEKTFVEDEGKSNESASIINQANIGGYQVSVVDANSPLLSDLGLTQEDLAKLSGHNKRSITNASMLASDSTQTATYAENPRPNYPSSEYSPSQNAPSYKPPYDPSKYPPPPDSSYAERQYKPNDQYSQSPAPRMHSDPSHASYPSHPPPQGSYDAKSYRAVQNGSPQGPSNYNYPPPAYNNYPPPAQSYNNPPASYSHPSPSASSYNPPPQSPPSYNHPPPPPSSYNPHSPPSTTYNHQSPPPTSYNPQRSSGEPWRQSSQYHTDWDDGSKKQESSWHSGPFPPHPPPLPHSSTSSSSGSYYPKPSYGPAPDKSGHRLAASYVKPESGLKPSYSSSSSSSSGHSSRKPYYSPSSYSSSSSKGPERGGSESYAESSYHHHAAPSKPGITISFKAKSPGHHGVSIPVSLGPLDLLKKLSPLSALNPLNNKKVTIGITIENKPHETHHEYSPY